MKKALITGQDGSYLAEQLLVKGYEVYGIISRISSLKYFMVFVERTFLLISKKSKIANK